MRKRWFMVGMIFLLVPWLLVGCGISKEVHNTVVAERDTAQAQVSTLQGELSEAEAQIASIQSELDTANSELQSARGELETVESQLESVSDELSITKSELQSVQNELNKAKTELQSTHSDLSQVAALYSSLAKKLRLGEQVFAYNSARLQWSEAVDEGNKDEEKRLRLLILSIFKSHDSLVEDVGDAELSRLWGESWGEYAREKSEEEQSLFFTFDAYAKFLDRLSEITGDDMYEMLPLLAD